VPHSHLEKEREGDVLLNKEQHQEYMSGVGTLLYYATHTRLDIANAVRELSKFMSCPRESHRKALQHCYRYLAYNPDYCLTFTRNLTTSDLAKLFALWIDASYADDLDTRKSTEAYLFIIDKTAVCWSSHTQKFVAGSTMESELGGVAHGQKKLIPVHETLKEMKLLPADHTFLVYQDNQSAIAFMNGSRMKAATRHVAVRYFRMMEAIDAGLMRFVYVASALMLADILTKNESAATIERCLPSVMG